MLRFTLDKSIDTFTPFTDHFSKMAAQCFTDCKEIHEWNSKNQASKPTDRYPKRTRVSAISKLAGVHKIHQYQEAQEEWGLSDLNVSDSHWTPDRATVAYTGRLPSPNSVMVCQVTDKYPWEEEAVMMIRFRTPDDLGRFLYYISQQYKESLEQKKHDEHLEKVSQFRNRHYETFVRLGGPDTLASALTSYLMTMTGDLAKVFHLPNLLHSGDWYVWERLLEYHTAIVSGGFKSMEQLWEEDELVYDLTCYRHVHDLFPPLEEFVKNVYATCKGETPNGDCYCGAVMEDADVTFGKVLLGLVMKLRMRQVLNSRQ
jgi:hypothetical protein